MMELTQKRVLELLRYDQNSGQLFWRTSRKGVPSHRNLLAGSIKSRGYIKLHIDKRFYFAHRLIWLYSFGKWPISEIDHIDGDPSNNRLNNLREATRSQNTQNSSIRSDNSSGHAGIHWDSKRQVWRVRVHVNGKPKYIGRYSDIEDAVKARLRAEAIHYKQYSRALANV